MSDLRTQEEKDRDKAIDAIKREIKYELMSDLQLATRIYNLEANNKILTKALEFYADRGNIIDEYPCNPLYELDQGEQYKEVPFGTTARNALQAVKGDK